MSYLTTDLGLLHGDDAAEARHENAIDRVAELEAERDALAVRLAEVHVNLHQLRDCALLAKDALAGGDPFSYGLQVGLILNALIGPAAVGVAGPGEALRAEDDLGLRVAGGGI